MMRFKLYWIKVSLYAVYKLSSFKNQDKKKWDWGREKSNKTHSTQKVFIIKIELRSLEGGGGRVMMLMFQTFFFFF